MRLWMRVEYVSLRTSKWGGDRIAHTGRRGSIPCLQSWTRRRGVGAGGVLSEAVQERWRDGRWGTYTEEIYSELHDVQQHDCPAMRDASIQVRAQGGV